MAHASAVTAPTSMPPGQVQCCGPDPRWRTVYKSGGHSPRFCTQFGCRGRRSGVEVDPALVLGELGDVVAGRLEVLTRQLGDLGLVDLGDVAVHPLDLGV